MGIGNKGRLKRYWDIATLGKFKYQLLGIWFLGWVIPRLLHRFPRSWEGYDLELYFIYKNLPHYNLASHLNYLWDTSSINHWSGVALISIVLFLLAANVFRQRDP